MTRMAWFTSRHNKYDNPQFQITATHDGYLPIITIMAQYELIGLDMIK